MPDVEAPGDEAGVAPAQSGGELTKRLDALALSPDQTTFTADQKAVMRALGWEIDEMSPAEVYHFNYFCVANNVDPFLREAMPIKTADGIVPIMRIAGMRKRAEDTGEYEGLTRHFEFQDAGLSWHDGWPDTSEEPVACRIGVYRRGWREPIEGSVRTEEAKVYEPVKHKDGSLTWELAARWQKLIRMLKVSAEADGLRRAFPTALSGFYTPEEMARVKKEREQAYLARLAAEGRARRREAYGAARASEPTPERSDVVEGIQDGTVVEKPATIGDTMQAVTRLIRQTHEATPERETVEPAADVEEAIAAPAEAPVPVEVLALSEEDRVTCLRAELAEQATILGATPEFLAQRFTVTYEDEPFEAWGSEMLLRVVAFWRKGVIAKLRKDGRYEEAAAYSEVDPDYVDQVDVLFGRAQ